MMIDPRRAEGRGWFGARTVALSLAVVAAAEPVGGARADAGARAATNPLERIVVTADGRGFVGAVSGRPFVPWGFNYDHDEDGRLLEDYWTSEWPKVEADFREMKDLGANVVRVHLQFGRFMTSPSEPDAGALAQFRRLVRLAEATGLYLDVTGLGCYHKKDVPAWYDALGDAARWDAQAVFWAAVARVGRGSPAVLFYDLMNEPVAPQGTKRGKDWLGPPFGGSCFVQWIALETGGRAREAVAQAWVRKLAGAIRGEDPEARVTVGLVPWSLKKGKGLYSGFDPRVLAGDLDLVCVHLYPEKGKLAEDMETLRGFAVGKPLIVEETFPLKCGPEEMGEFMRRSRPEACGWIGFYWGRPIADYRPAKTIPDALMLGWLELFRAGPPVAP